MPFLFAVTLFVSAFLLFLVQPMVDKMVLPYLGGQPAVWNTCMVFFQAALLLGYLYAHEITRRFGLRRQLGLHLLLLLVPLVPLALLRLDVRRLATDWLPPPSETNPIPWLLLVLTVAAGLPFFVVATSAPLLQKWFSETDSPSAKDPHFLYGASNLGSMLALVGYPTVIEPRLGLATQAYVWGAGYAVLLVLVVLCGVLARRSANRVKLLPWTEENAAPEPVAQSADSNTISTGRWLRWAALAFVPSSLMLGVTTHITTDVAPIPLLWVLPLALYLLSFILVFSKFSTWWVVFVGPAFQLVGAALWIASGDVSSLGERVVEWQHNVRHSLGMDAGPMRLLAFVVLFLGIQVLLGWCRLLHAAMVVALPFVIVALLFSGEIVTLLDNNGLVVWTEMDNDLGHLWGLGIPVYKDYYGQARLYVWETVSLHLAGLFVAAMVCHGELARTRPPAQSLTGFYICMSVGGVLGGMFNALVAPVAFSTVLEYPLVIAGACLLLPRLGLSRTGPMRGPEVFWTTLVGMVGGLTVLFILAAEFLTTEAALSAPEPVQGLALQFVQQYGKTDKNTLVRERGFFGLVRIQSVEGGNYHKMVHGTTDHGMQCMIPDRRGEPLTYFHREGPIGQLFDAVQRKHQTLRIGVLGMGTGTLAGYAQPGWEMTFYEIDPAVVRLASDPNDEYFSYINDARRRGVRVDVVLGDGRLQMQKAPADAYDLIFMDAFTSDAVPVHLLTREAMQMYLTKLAPGGVIIVNIANRYLDFEGVLGNLARELGLQARACGGYSDYSIDMYGSHWVALARRDEDFGSLRDVERGNRTTEWYSLPGHEPLGVWTDDYSNLLSVLKWKR